MNQFIIKLALSAKKKLFSKTNSSLVSAVKIKSGLNKKRNLDFLEN